MRRRHDARDRRMFRPSVVGEQSFYGDPVQSLDAYLGQPVPRFPGHEQHGYFRQHQGSGRSEAERNMNMNYTMRAIQHNNWRLFSQRMYVPPNFGQTFHSHSRVNWPNGPYPPGSMWPFQEVHSIPRVTQELHRLNTTDNRRVTAPPRFTSDTRNKGPRENGSRTLRRNWQTLPRHYGTDGTTFSLVTYNLLSDSLLYENMHLYEGCDESDLNWSVRREKLLAELLNYNAEILCLQEIDAEHYENWFHPKLKEAGYSGFFNQRTGGKPDGCATFYKCDKFTVVKHKLVKYFTPEIQALSKDNVGIVLLLKSAQQVANQFICVANTHLLFNKKRGDIKLAQLIYLFAEINALATLSDDSSVKTYCPVILCGDLNSVPYSPLYDFISKGKLHYSAICSALISGQLTASQANSGPSSRKIQSPLLPWEFGVSNSCEWRDGIPQESRKSVVQSTKDESKERKKEITPTSTRTRNEREPDEMIVQESKNDVPISGQPKESRVSANKDNLSTNGNQLQDETEEYARTGTVFIPWYLRSAYTHKSKDGTPEVSTFHTKGFSNVDYIFFSTGIRKGHFSCKQCIQKGKLYLLGRVELTSKYELERIRLPPNKRLPSDHLSLKAQFVLI